MLAVAEFLDVVAVVAERIPVVEDDDGDVVAPAEFLRARRELGAATHHLELLAGTRIPLELDVDLRRLAFGVLLDDRPIHDLADGLETRIAVLAREPTE